MSIPWINASERKPTHIYTVLLWVTGSELHFNEDYADVGMFNAVRQKWQVGRGDGTDMDVEVSHWAHIGNPLGEKQ